MKARILKDISVKIVGDGGYWTAIRQFNKGETYKVVKINRVTVKIEQTVGVNTWVANVPLVSVDLFLF